MKKIDTISRKIIWENAEDGLFVWEN